MGITDTYKAVFNGYVALVRAMNGGTTQHLTHEQDRAVGSVVPGHETRTPQYSPRPHSPQYDGRRPRSHCNKNIGYKSSSAR